MQSRNALQLEDYAVEDMLISPGKKDKPAGKAVVAVSTSNFKHKKDESRFLTRMEIIVSAAGDEPPPYEMKISVLGKFSVGKGGARGVAMDNIAPSLLYSAMRDFIATVTSRSVHGKFLLPIMSFPQGQGKK